MSKLVALMSMSLDGFVADPNDDVSEVFAWYMNSGDVEFKTGGSDPMTFKVSAPSAEHLRALWSELGAVLTGRRTFDKANGWGGNHAWGPAFVVTHKVPAGWPRARAAAWAIINQDCSGHSNQSLGVTQLP
jgi:dihydrofolate reductase